MKRQGCDKSQIIACLILVMMLLSITISNLYCQEYKYVLIVEMKPDTVFNLDGSINYIVSTKTDDYWASVITADSLKKVNAPIKKAYRGIKYVIFYPFKFIYKVASNKYVQRYGSTALFVFGQGVCDAKCDGYIWDNLYGDKKTYGVSEKDWHLWKNLGRISTWSAVCLKALAVGQGNMTPYEAVFRQCSEFPITNVVWHKIYYKTRYNNYWDTDHSGRYFYYPDPFNKFRDNYVSLTGNQVFIADGIQAGLGIVGLIVTEIKW